VLLAGWQSPHGPKSAEIYDPATNSFTRAADMICPRGFNPVSTTLADGRVLLAGGFAESESGHSKDLPDTIEAYDAAAHKWSVIGRLPAEVRPSDAVTLRGGLVLFITETGDEQGVLLFDPASGSIEPVGPPDMAVNGSPVATLLRDGSVVITHLEYGEGTPGSSNAYLYDPQTRQTSPLPRMAHSRSGHQASLMADGRVLITGGTDNLEPSAEIFDPATRTFAVAGRMVAPRVLHRDVALPDGRVLSVGGIADVESEPLPPGVRPGMSPEEIHQLIRSQRHRERPELACEAEIYDPTTNRFSALPEPPASPETDSGPHTGLHLVMPGGEVLFLTSYGAMYFTPGTNSWRFPQTGRR
jgi:hypothetical protein